jgi:hypothetical protein
MPAPRRSTRRYTDGVIRVAVMVLAVSGCGRFGYDPQGTGGGGDASADGGPAGDAAATVLGERLADSQDDFDIVQGQEGWWYGYWNAEAEPDAAYDPVADFELMAYADSIWHPPGDESTWAYLAWWGGHPSSGPLIIPIRRWVSDASGPARITLHHRKSDTSGGDGTRAILTVDGAIVRSTEVDGGDGVGVVEEIDIDLEVGTLVEQLLHPIGHDAQDTTELGFEVRALVPAL